MHILGCIVCNQCVDSRHQKDKTSLGLNVVRDVGVWGCNGISWTICKQSAPCSKTDNHTNTSSLCFSGRLLFLTPNQQCQSTRWQLDAAYHCRCIHCIVICVLLCLPGPIYCWSQLCVLQKQVNWSRCSFGVWTRVGPLKEPCIRWGPWSPQPRGKLAL